MGLGLHVNTLRGRIEESRSVEAAVRDLTSVLVLGEPGIGKSALLRHAYGAAGACGGRTVVSALGVPSEAQLPFAGLQQLVAPFLDLVHEVPAMEATALRVALGLEEGGRPEPIAVALAASDLLRAAAVRRPIVVIVDDAQWLDPQSQEAVALIARRAEGHPIAVLVASRTGHPGPVLDAGLPVLELHGLDDAAADALLDRGASHLTPLERRRVRDQARGNPLALLELPSVWSSGSLGEQVDDVPLSAHLERAFAARLAELPAHARDAVLVAAVDSSDDLTEIGEAIAVFAGPFPQEHTASALTAAQAAGLLIVADGRIEFRHPLVRSAVLQSETLERRQRANAALAEVLVHEPYRRTWHRAQSIVGPDDGVASELEDNAAVALARGGVVSAIRDFRRAAQLVSTSARRGRLLLFAAEQAFGIGRADLVHELVSSAAETDLGSLDRARLEWLREIFHDGTPGDATRVEELCASAAEAAAHDDVDLALNLLLGAALRCWWADTGPEARARVVGVTRSLSGAESDPRYVAAVAVAEPVLEAAAVYRHLDGVSADEIDDAEALRLLGMAAHAIGDETRAADLLARAERLLREEGRFGLLPHVLSMEVQVNLEIGDWDKAARAADEGRRLAADTGQPIWNTGTIVCEARANGLRGNVDEALALAARAEVTANRQRLNDLLACVRLARGAAWYSAGEPTRAFETLAGLFDAEDVAYHQRERFAGVMFMAEAAVRSGRRDAARLLMPELERAARITPAPILQVHLLYARAVLADGDAAAPLFEQALQADLDRWPWARARIQLAFARWALDRGYSEPAANLLHEALATFDAIGAAAWSSEAAHALAHLPHARRTGNSW